MRRFRPLVGLALLAPTLAFAQATAREASPNGPVFPMKMAAAQPNQTVLGTSGLQPAPSFEGPRVAPGTPGALIPKRSMGAARAAPPGGMVAQVQQRLAAEGYDAGPADGRLGRRTAAAIRHFQADRGIRRDGKVSPHLLDLLDKA